MQRQEPKKRVIALDYGAARIGMAISDETHLIASPYKTVAAHKRHEQTVKALLDEFRLLQENLRCEIHRIVIGMPLRMNGQMGSQADEVKAFADLLQSQINVEIVLWDERLTTVQAERALREASMNRKKRAQHIDNVAAAIILQSYLDSHPRVSGS